MEHIKQDQIINIPNALTVVRILLLPVVVWRFMIGDATGALIAYLAAMLTDALVQYLVWKQWPKIFLIEGSNPADRALAGALKLEGECWSAAVEDVTGLTRWTMADLAGLPE